MTPEPDNGASPDSSARSERERDYIDSIVFFSLMLGVALVLVDMSRPVLGISHQWAVYLKPSIVFVTVWIVSMTVSVAPSLSGVFVAIFGSFFYQIALLLGVIYLKFPVNENFKSYLIATVFVNLFSAVIASLFAKLGR